MADVDSEPGRRVPRAVAGALLVGLLAALTAAAVVLLVAWPAPEDPPVERSEAATSPAPAAAAAAFPTSACQPAPLADGALLGIGIPRPARLTSEPAEAAVLDAAIRCFTRIAGRTPMLRTQLPIDVLRRPGTATTADETAELRAFAGLLRTHRAAGLISIRAHDFTRCGRDGAPPPSERSALAPGEALRPCEYPTPALYGELFEEIVRAMQRAAPGADLRWASWNEPDHPSFTLAPLGQRQAALVAGRYWAVASEAVGAERVLAGAFADRTAGRLRTLRQAFVEGAGAQPPAWALHPYRDLTDLAAPGAIEAGFAADVAPADVWLTELTPRIHGRRGLSGDGAGQYAQGVALRSRLAARPSKVLLYLLQPPSPERRAGGDGWDSALADAAGAARPFVCGLAGLPIESCPGSPDAFGG